MLPVESRRQKRRKALAGLTVREAAEMLAHPRPLAPDGYLREDEAQALFGQSLVALVDEVESLQGQLSELSRKQRLS